MSDGGALELLPRIGVGAVRFGQREDEVTALLGEPDGVDEGSVEDWRLVYYEAQGLELAFDEEEAGRLVTVRCQSPAVEAGGIALVGCSEAELIELGSSLAWGDYTLERSEGDGSEGDELEYPGVDLLFWIVDDAVVAVLAGAEIDEGDEYVWPA